MTTSQESNRLPILADEVRKAHAGVKASAQAAAAHAIAAGQVLTKAKLLLKHGEWLPWLKQHAGCSERTAQLYMKIVRLGFKSATVADLGLNAAVKAIAVVHDDSYDPFYGRSDEEVREWLLFQLFLTKRSRTQADAIEQHIERLLRNGWSLTDWLASPGDNYRRRWGYPTAAIDGAFILELDEFKISQKNTSLASIKQMIEVASGF